MGQSSYLKFYHVSRCMSVLASAAHILKLELYREDEHGPCARMMRKFVKRSIFLKIKKKKKKKDVCQSLI